MNKYITQTELAEIIGSKQPYISKLVKEGEIPPECFDGKNLLRVEVLNFFKQTASPNGKIFDVLNDIEPGNDDNISIKHKKKKYEKTEVEVNRLKLQLSKEQEQLIEKAVVADQAFTVFRAYRDWLIKLPVRIAPEFSSEFGLLSREREIIIFFDKVIKEQLNEISEELEKIGNELGK